MPTHRGGNLVVRFGTFEADLETGELRRKGLKVRMQQQPFEVLRMLLERPGDLVRREELRQRLWPGSLFVEFDHGLNKAVHKIRIALDDPPDNPRFIETLSRRGYRFIAPVEGQAHRTADREAAGSSPAFRLVWDGQAIPLAEGPNDIGRDEESAVWIDLASVSRRHARIEVRDDGATLEDLRSKNGTLLNGHRITDCSPLKDGDEIDVGSAHLVFHARAIRRSTQSRPRHEE